MEFITSLQHVLEIKPSSLLVLTCLVFFSLVCFTGKIPPQADLGELAGIQSGFTSPVSMIDGGLFDSVKAYKDSKVSVSITVASFVTSTPAHSEVKYC